MGCNQSPSASPNGIVALSPALTEVVLELSPEKLAATSYYTTDARAASVLHLNQDGNLETIISLRPALVLGQPYDALLLEKLEKNHIKTSVHALDSLNDIEQASIQIADLLGERAKAEQLMKKFRSQLDENRAKFARNPPPLRALLIVDTLDARMMQFYIAARSTFMAELAQGCGLEIIDDSSAPWARIDAEALMRLNPDAIIYFAYQKSDADAFAAQFAQRYPQLDAVKNQKIMVYLSPEFVIPGPGAAQRQNEFCRQIDDFFRQSR